MGKFTRIGVLVAPILSKMPVGDLAGLKYEPSPPPAEHVARVKRHNAAQRQMFLDTQQAGAVKAWQDANGVLCYAKP